LWAACASSAATRPPNRKTPPNPTPVKRWTTHRRPSVAACQAANPAEDATSAANEPRTNARPARINPRQSSSSAAASEPRQSHRSASARDCARSRTRGTLPPASATKSMAPQTGPEATPRSLIGEAPDGDGVERRFVDTVETEELVGQPVVVAAEWYCAQTQSGRGEQDVLGHVARLEQSEAVPTHAVLEAGPPEHGGDEHHGGAAGNDLRVGRERVHAPPRERVVPHRQCGRERIEVIQARLEPVDPKGSDV